MADFDRILASSPINATAARQLAPGEHWTPSVAIQDYFADLPKLKSNEYYADKGFRSNSESFDFRGMEFGRLRVLGVMDKQGNGPASWACRCKCGSFCTRTAKSLKVAMRGGNTFIGMCGLCEYQEKLRTGWTPKPRGVRRG